MRAAEPLRQPDFEDDDEANADVGEGRPRRARFAAPNFMDYSQEAGDAPRELHPHANANVPAALDH